MGPKKTTLVSPSRIYMYHSPPFKIYMTFSTHNGTQRKCRTLNDARSSSFEFCFVVQFSCIPVCVKGVYYRLYSRRGQTTPLMFHEGYICLVYIFLNQVWQMSFLCSPVYFNLEVVTKCQMLTS